MSHSRTLIPICSLLATALLAFAQPPTPRAARAPLPPDAWEQTPPAAPRPVAAPMAPLPPTPPMPVKVSADDWEQTPTPPVPPAPAVAPMAPMPPVPPAPPVKVFSDDFDFQINPDIQVKIEMAREQVEMAREQAQNMKFELQENFKVKEEMMAAKEMAMADMRSKFNFAFAPQGEPTRPRCPLRRFAA